MRQKSIILALFCCYCLLLFIGAVGADSADYWFQKGLLLRSQSKYPEAIQAFDQALQLNPDNPYYWNEKGIALGDSGQWHEAIATFDTALAKDPGFSVAHTNKCWAYLNLEQYPDALTSCNASIALYANDAMTWNDLGDAYRNLGRNEEAMMAFDKAIDLNPYLIYAWENKGDILLKTGKRDEAIAALKKGLAIDPNYPRLWALIDEAVNGTPSLSSTPSNNGTAQNISLPIQSTPAITPKQQDTPQFLLPLAIAILVIVVGGGAYGYIKYKQKTPESISLPPLTTPMISSKKDHRDVFISYAQVDKPTADAACAKLESRNIRCWIAPRDVSAGKHFPEAIIEGIEGSRVMVLIFSSHSNNSQHVIRELTTAVNKGLIIIPFRIENVLPSRSMEYLIGLPHWLDALTPPLDHHLDTLAGTLEKFLSDKTPDSDEKK